jgi:hypothetical protein
LLLMTCAHDSDGPLLVDVVRGTVVETGVTVVVVGHGRTSSSSGSEVTVEPGPSLATAW